MYTESILRDYFLKHHHPKSCDYPALWNLHWEAAGTSENVLMQGLLITAFEAEVPPPLNTPLGYTNELA